MHRNLFQLSSVVILSASLCACSSGVDAPPPQIEVVTIEQQLEDDINRTPTEFTVAFSEDRDVWARANYFLNQYTDGASRSKANNENIISNRSSRKDAYVYEIAREQGREGVHYVVRCFPSTKDARGSLAIVNARNVSRFLKDGNLEVSMLHPPVS